MNKLDNLDVMEKILKPHNLPKLAQEETENVKGFTTILDGYTPDGKFH